MVLGFCHGEGAYQMQSQKLGDETHCEMFQFEMHNELMHFLEIGDWK